LEEPASGEFLPPSFAIEDVYCYCRAHYQMFIGVEEYQAQFAKRETAEFAAVFAVCECG
jgi:hypothetical protein